jgi:hypothetical protein
MGLFASLSQSSLLSSSSTASSRGSAGSTATQAPASGGRKRPETDGEVAEAIAAARAALKDPETVERQLTVGGEEGLTDAQLKR